MYNSSSYPQVDVTPQQYLSNPMSLEPSFVLIKTDLDDATVYEGSIKQETDFDPYKKTRQVSSQFVQATL